MGESKQQHRERLEKQGWRETRPGYFTKANKANTGFSSTQEALDHHETQSNIGAVDKQIEAWSGSPPK